MLFGPLSYRIGITACSERTIRIAILKKTCKGYLPIHLQEGSLQDILPLIKKYSYATTIASLSSSDVLIKYSESELKNFNHIQANIRFQFEQLLPFPTESALFRFLFSKQKSHKTDAFIFVTRKEKTQTLLNQLSNYNLIIDRLSCCQLDLPHLFSNQNKYKNLTGPVVYFGAMSAHFLLLKEGIPLLSHSLELSSEKSPEQFLYNALEYSKKHHPELIEKNIYIINPPKNFLERTPFNEIIPDIFSRLNESERSIFGETIAAALGGFNLNSPDFREDNEKLRFFSFPRMIKKWYPPLAYLSLICAGITGITGFTLTNLARSKVRENIHGILEDSTKKHTSIANHNRSPKHFCVLLEKKLKELRQSAHYSLVPEDFSAVRILSKITSLPVIKESNVIFTYYDYEISDFPKLTNPDAPYVAQITLKGTVEHRSLLPKLKESFAKTFSKSKSNKFLWDDQNCNFSVSFCLSKTVGNKL